MHPVAAVHQVAAAHPVPAPRPVPATQPAAAAHPATEAGTAPAFTTNEGAPLHVTRGRRDTVLHVPASLDLRDGRFDLLVHFHGPHDRTIAAFEQANLHAAIVSLNLGEGGATYEGTASAPNLLDRLVAFVEGEIAKSGRLPNARVGRIALSSWSAGFGAVREILRRPGDRERIDALLMADGLFTDWSSPSHVRGVTGKIRPSEDLAKIGEVVDFARRATEGEKLFVLTHTQIERRSYADAPDCAETMLRLFGVDRGVATRSPPRRPGSAGSEAVTYAADLSNFHVWGNNGKKWSDHIAQHKAMGTQHFAALRVFWRRS